jgi:thiol-disulfide isomerase/thioredoxin
LSNPLETQWHFKCSDPQKAFESNALNELQNLTERFDFNATTFVAKIIRSSDTYNHEIDNALSQLYQKRLNVLSRFNSDNNLSAEGYKALNAYLRYEYFRNRLLPVYATRFTHNPLPDWYADSLLKIDLNKIDTGLIALYPVQGVCIFVNRLQALTMFKNATLPQTFGLAKHWPDSEVRNVLLYQIMQLQRDMKALLFKQYTDSLTRYSSNPTLNQIIFENLKQALAVDNSKDLLYTLANKPFYVSKLLAIKDTVLYIDFWASWCVPCLQEMPASFKLKEVFKDQPLKFFYISIDTKGDSWKNKSKDIGLTENSFWLPDTEQSELVRSLKVQSIPRYVILKNGKVINQEAPRPTDKNLKQVLLSCLNNK